MTGASFSGQIINYPSPSMFSLVSGSILASAGVYFCRFMRTPAIPCGQMISYWVPLAVMDGCNTRLHV